MQKKRSIRKKTKKLSKKIGNQEDAISTELIIEGEKLENTVINRIKHFFHLHVDNYGSSHGRRIEGTLFILNFLAIAIFIISTHQLEESVKRFLVISEIIIISVFVVEYAVRMWIAPKKIKHFFNPYSIVDLLSIVPILAHFGNLGFFRIFRILRLFRMLRVLRFQRIFKAKNTLFGNLSDSQLVIIRIVLTVFTIIIVSSGLIWNVENKINPGELGTIWDAMYFSVVTLATVGYGDITPLSPWGKAITVVMILSGIALIPWQLGKLIKILFMEATKTKVKCKKCGLEDHDKDAVHCKMCGTVLKRKKVE